MSADTSNSPGDDYFNDLSQGLPNESRKSQSPHHDEHATQSDHRGDYVPRPKRIACVLCRRRKLKCDGTKPSCGTCSRLGHECAYDEVRKKSGPKRGYVKHLETRLGEVEKLLKAQNPPESNQPSANLGPSKSQAPLFENAANLAIPGGSAADIDQLFAGSMMPDAPAAPSFNVTDVDNGFPWEMMELGVEEALPSQDVVDDLHDIFFRKVHPSMPMIHRPRYLAAMNLAPNMRPPVCLRYAMWTNVCSISAKYSALAEVFYQRARKYAELDEMKGHGENMISVAHSQCWTFIAAYEFKMMYFPRAWLSVGRATRLAQMMGLHRQDGYGLDVKQCIPPPRDWTEREERRRTFWQCFVHDRCASVGTGWPMTVDERDILTNLPANEDAFEKSRPEKTVSLADGMTADGAATLSPFAGVVLMSCLFGRNLTHLHRPDKNDNDHDLNGEFWKRHRALDNILLNISLSLPSHLRLPDGIGNPNIIMLNMNIHTSTICLHQASIFKADKNRMPQQINAESKRRCIIAADQITCIMKMICHLDLAEMNPFLPFCLYVAARVFVQYLKSRPDDSAVKSSMHFLLTAMQALKGMNPLTESFLVQLDVDLEGSGLELPRRTTEEFKARMRKSIIEMDGHSKMHCSPLIGIHNSREQSQQRSPPSTNPQAAMETSFRTSLDLNAQIPQYGQFSQQNLAAQSRQSSLINPTTYSGGMDIDQPSESISGNQARSQSGSEQHTPSNSSNHPSSHTSYSPNNPSIDDPAFSNFDMPVPNPNDQTTNTNTRPRGGLLFAVGASYNDFNLSYQDMLAATPDPPSLDNQQPQSGKENPFNFNAAWSQSVDGRNARPNPVTDSSTAPGISTGMTPKDMPELSGGTGMTPLSMDDPSQWGQMLEGMGWNGWQDVQGAS